MEILWALLDLVTILVLASGLYLRIARARGERARPPASNAGAGACAVRSAKIPGFVAQWRWPIGLALLTVVGLLSALRGEGGIWW